MPTHMGPPSKPPHVLVFPFPAQGHINGALDVSKKLAALGVSITFACTEAYINRMISDGFDAGGLPICLVGVPDGLPSNKSITDRIDQIKILIDATENMGPVLEALLMKQKEQSNPVTCILYDFILWWIGGLGRKLHIPAYIFYAMSASFFSYLIHIPKFASQGRLPLGCHTDLSDQSNVFTIPGFPTLHVSEVPDISWSPNPVSSFEFTLRSTASWRDATGILFNTVYELENEVIDALRELAPEMHISAIGPILPNSFLIGDDDQKTCADDDSMAPTCMRWLNEQPVSSVLYIAFGTIASLSIPQIHELAYGLEASDHRFLWVIRIPQGHQEVNGKQLHDKLPHSDDHVLPKGFEKRTKHRGMVLWEPCPQRRVLAHKAIGGFLTHCGWNSTLESLCKGVPMLCWPMFGDQPMNSKFLVDVLNIGKAFKRRKDGIVSRDEVERVIRELMGHGQGISLSLRIRASEVERIASKAALPGGPSEEHLHGFVYKITHHGP